MVPSTVSSAPVTPYHLSSIIGTALVLAGGLMQLQAVSLYARNQERIGSGNYAPGRRIELTMASSMLVIAMLLAVYSVLTV